MVYSKGLSVRKYKSMAGFWIGRFHWVNRRRATHGAIWPNFERTVCELAMGSMDGKGRDPCVLPELRARVCVEFSAPAAVWSTVARKMT